MRVTYVLPRDRAHEVASSKQHKSISATDVLKALELVEFGDIAKNIQGELQGSYAWHPWTPTIELHSQYIVIYRKRTGRRVGRGKHETRPTLRPRRRRVKGRRRHPPLLMSHSTSQSLPSTFHDKVALNLLSHHSKPSPKTADGPSSVTRTKK